MKKRIILIFILLFLFHKSYSQAKETSDINQFFYNISIGSIIGAVGAVINKKPEQKFGETLFKGFYQGALGGYVTFESKRLINLAQKNNDWKLLWASKLVNAGGNSIKENAALNKNFWEKWHINIGFNRIEFETKNRFKVNYKILPISLFYTIGIASQAKFELGKSLKSGQFIFSSNTNRFVETNSIGVTYPGGIVLYTPDKDNFKVLSHEIIHWYQYNDFSQLETFVEKPLQALNRNNKVFNKINKWIHYDYRYLPAVIWHSIDYQNSVYYYDVFLEREAGYYSNTYNRYLQK